MKWALVSATVAVAAGGASIADARISFIPSDWPMARADCESLAHDESANAVSNGGGNTPV